MLRSTTVLFDPCFWLIVRAHLYTLCMLKEAI